VRLIRGSLRYVSWEERKAVARDLKAIGTTNAAESVNTQVRKVTKHRGAFLTPDSATKVLCLRAREFKGPRRANTREGAFRARGNGSLDARGVPEGVVRGPLNATRLRRMESRVARVTSGPMPSPEMTVVRVAICGNGFLYFWWSVLVIQAADPAPPRGPLRSGHERGRVLEGRVLLAEAYELFDEARPVRSLHSGAPRRIQRPVPERRAEFVAQQQCVRNLHATGTLRDHPPLTPAPDPAPIRNFPSH